MRKISLAILAIFVAFLLTGCTSSNQYGKCVGLNGNEDPALKYEYSAKNIALGAIFFYMIAPPIVVALNEMKCPVGKK